MCGRASMYGRRSDEKRISVFNHSEQIGITSERIIRDNLSSEILEASTNGNSNAWRDVKIIHLRLGTTCSETLTIPLFVIIVSKIRLGDTYYSNNSTSRMSYLTRGKEDRFFLYSSNTECNKDISSAAKFQSGPSTSSWVRDVGSIAGADAKGGAGLETEERNGTINFVFSSLSNGGVSPHSS
ncbi:hypothetical protein V1478_003413 [Vespula squamosa]|uniref:Uncharacterized protein n=1 Tax=Vespula squamosa TaxID=30214 RepID=A0ABD2BLQ8_VESSQ